MTKIFTSSLLAIGLLAAPALAQTVAPASTDATAFAAGQKLAFDKAKGNCLACHVIVGGTAPGNVGPALQNMKVMVPDEKTLYAVIYDEAARNPSTIMPAFGRNGILSPDEINNIIAFLYTK